MPRNPLYEEEINGPGDPTRDIFRVVYNNADERDPDGSRYVGTFTKDDAMKARTLDAMEWCGVDDETAQRVVRRIEYDYMVINWGWPICCSEHETFLKGLKAAAISGSPIKPGRPPKH